MPDAAAPTDAVVPGREQARWEASLSLAFESRDTRTVLARRSHHGPLAVQKPFHPEPDGTCHVIVLHPPGGVVGGDDLTLAADAGAGSKVVLTTPAATKLYRSAGPLAAQRQLLRCAADSRVEWVPNETIVYAGAQAVLETRIDLAPGARFLGWDVVCLGRPASNEDFAQGALRQAFEVWRGETPLFIERARYDGGGEALASAWGLGGQPVVGVLVATAELDDEAMESLREATVATAPGRFAVTRLDSVLVGRYVGSSVEEALAAFRAARRTLRTTVWGSSPYEPRIWST